MSLPSNYTKLDYIESHGTEYFDTGFKPNQDTRVVMDCNLYSYSAIGYIFGCRGNNSQNYANRYGILYNGSYRTDYGVGNGPSYSSSLTYGTRVTIDKNKRVCTIGNESLTNAESTFQSLYNMALFCAIEGGTPKLFTNVQLYSCKIYDNGTLVRDFIPAMNASGTIGLWDDVNSTFYTNAGTGTLTTGTKHKTRIDGTGYEAKSGRTLIGGTGYSIQKGRTLIGGTGYDISLGTPVGELDVGTSVYMNVDGTRREFIIVHQGNPDGSKYDASCNGTWVWQKYVYETHGWEAVSNFSDGSKTGCDYTRSGMNDWINGDYLNKFDSDIKALIKTVKIPYQSNLYKYDSWSYPTGSDGLEVKAFLPSLKEMGITAIQYMSIPQIGARLDYFKEYTQYPYEGDPNFAAHTPNGQTAEFFTRQITQEDDLHTNYFNTNSQYVGVSSSTYIVLYTAGILPFMILPSEEAFIDDDFNIIAP